MECFASNTAVDPTQIRIRDPGFASPLSFGEVATVRGVLTADEAEQRLGELFTRFMEELHSDHAKGELKEGHGWVLQGSTQLHNNLPLSLRIFRELLPQAFLMTLFGPENAKAPARYLFNSLDELRGMNGTLVFSGTAHVCPSETKTHELEP
ncbi:MAG: hypothetical protein KUG77_08770 [Nannocystaceae bacterium]|nr:hypothetical protein [Nannocystaceae bacterium]